MRRARELMGWRPCAVAVMLMAVGTGLGGCPDLAVIPALIPIGKAPSSGDYAEVNGKKIFYKLAGDTGPHVILFSGLDENVRVWDKVYGDMAEFCTVLAYDRGGVGWSDSGENPRTASTICRELKGLLTELDFGPPYVLCAHSVAGLYARYFAASYPGDISGILLIDTSHEDMWRRQALQMGPLQVALAQQMMGVAQGAEGVFQIGALGEFYNIENTTNEVRNERLLPWVPLLLLSQDMGNFAVLEKDENQPIATLLYRELYWEQATLSPRGVWQVVENTSHFIMIDQPEKVIDGLKWVIDQADGN